MAWYDIFGGSVAKSIENIATEFIETDMESAEAKALMVKTLDPNGMMRRDLSTKVSNLYVFYVLVTVILIVMQSFGIGDSEQVMKATTAITELFVPITAMFSAIIGASFGVNGFNSYKEK